MLLKFYFCLVINALNLKHSSSYSLNLTENCGESFVKTQPDWRIVGGVQAVPGEFPWQVIVTRHFLNEYGDYMTEMCGGTIISSQFILTAGHCTHSEDLSGYKIYLGVHDLRRREGTEIISGVEKIIRHEHFGSEQRFNDIALVKLKGKIDFKNRHKFLKPICLASPSTKTDGNCYATGFGFRTERGQSAKVLMKVYEPLYNLIYCKHILHYVDYKTNICAGGRISEISGTCKGDSGGPLQCKASDGRWYQFGITSWGIPCANRGYPDVFTRVSAYYDWIQKIINEY